MFSKVKSAFELKKIVNKLRKEGKKVVFTNGCFDLLHLGHIRYLKKAKELGDVLVVGLNSDFSVRNLKGKNRPLVSQKERAEILSALQFVDYIVIFKENLPVNLIKQLKPDLQVKGGDYGKVEIPERKIVELYGGKVKIVKKEKGFSTTNLIKKILKRYGK